MSNAAVINATNSSGWTVGSPITIETGGDVVLKAYGTGSGSWSVTLSFAPVVGGVTGSPTTLTIGPNAPSAKTSVTKSDATQWVGWVSQAGGTWEASGLVEGYTDDEALANDIGYFASSANLPTKALKLGAKATLPSGPVTWRGAGVGWVADFAGLNVDATAMIPDLRQSLLAGAPLQTTGDSIAYVLGPTAQAQANTEYATLKTNRLEWCFFSGSTLINQDKLGAAATAWVDNPYSVYARLRSAPWPKSDGSTDWWNKGYCELVVDGEGVFALSYVLNNVNSCRVYVDGKILSGAASDGTIANAVSSGGNALQWVSLTLTGDKRRVISVQGPSNLVSIVHDAGITISKPDYVGKAIVFGESFASRFVSAGETSLIQTNIATSALRLLGWDVVDAATGGTGFLNNGGGGANGRDSYSGYIDLYLSVGVPLGFRPDEYDLVWLFGTGNDQGTVTTTAQYLAVIQKALNAFPKATIAVSSVYESFSTNATAKSLNDLLYAAVQAAGSRVKWVPVDSYYKWDKSGIWSGTGSVPAPARDGNADVYFSNATQGAGDRHPNNKGCAYGAKYYAAELVRAGIKYAIPQ